MQNERLLNINNRIYQAYKEEYINKEYSQEVLTQNRLCASAGVTINIANKYIEEIEENNKKIIELVGSHTPMLMLMMLKKL